MGIQPVTSPTFVLRGHPRHGVIGRIGGRPGPSEGLSPQEGGEQGASAVASNACAAGALRRGLDHPPPGPGAHACGGWHEVDRPGTGLHHALRHASRRGRSPSGLSSRHPQGAGCRRRRVESEGASALVRVASVGQRRADRGDLAAGRSPQHPRHRDRLPEATPAGDPVWSDCHGQALHEEWQSVWQSIGREEQEAWRLR